MANPNTRESLKQYALRALGKPVIEINVDEDQLEDRLDESLQYFAQYHSDGIRKLREANGSIGFNPKRTTVIT